MIVPEQAALVLVSVSENPNGVTFVPDTRNEGGGVLVFWSSLSEYRLHDLLFSYTSHC